MHKIVLLGTGRSSAYAIKYLLEKSRKNGWILEIGDHDPSPAKAWTKDSPEVRVFSIDIEDQSQRRAALKGAQLVISLLPTYLQTAVAEDALTLGAHMITASYTQKELRALSPFFAEKNLILLTEMGLDPGIDHMIAMKMIDRVRSDGHQIRSFYSCTGALLATHPTDENPWRYKFTWSPHQTIRAGSTGAQFIEEKKAHLIPYHQLFRRIKQIEIPDHGSFEAYANRDSSAYQDLYKLSEADTLYRGTLRPRGFSQAWDALVQAGLTDDRLRVDHLEQMTHQSFTSIFLPKNNAKSLKEAWAQHLGASLSDEIVYKLDWIGLFDDTPIGMSGSATAVEVLQHIFEKKWTLRETDQDKVILWKQIKYRDAENDALQTRTALCVCLGKDRSFTAVAKTVGLPIGIGACLILEGKLAHLKGLELPTLPEIYQPVLEELATHDIRYTEE